MGFDLYGQNKNSSTGEYFRNNVWWWRRLADFVINETGVIDEKDADGWHENGGHKVSADEAEQIANQLEYLISTGRVQEYAKEVQEKISRAEETNKKVQEKFDKLQERAIAETKEDRIIPRDYPEHLKAEWNNLWEERDNNENYPFDLENVKEFIAFCRESKGFRIC
jgi:hypothetical protein